mmetsp:Transcript_74617/g.218580  ORF Transcript_74617/g.218580 Transcript_74617/m.218580 type:complete len:319 (-) Transcript_74617:713-1669(-)
MPGPSGVSGVHAPHAVLAAVEHLRRLVRQLPELGVPQRVVAEADHHLLEALLGPVEAPLREDRLLHHKRRLLQAPEEGLVLVHHRLGVRVDLLLEGLLAVSRQEIAEQLRRLRPRDGPRPLQGAEAQGARPVRRRHVGLLALLDDGLALLEPLLHVVLRLRREVLLLVPHRLELPLLRARQRRRRGAAVGQEAAAREDLLVPHGLEHLREVLGGLPLDVLDLLPPLPDVVQDCLLELLVHVVRDLLHLVQHLQRLVGPAEALQGLRLPEEGLLVVLLQLERSVRRPEGRLPLVHLQRGVGLVVQAGAVHHLQLLVLPL